MSLEGQQLGRYRILRLIGSGGMGEVYLAEDPGINRQVAIKVMRSEGADSTLRLFQREAKAIAMLDHPNILPLYDYGEQSMGDVTLTYLVMPYRPDGSLASWLEQNQRAGRALSYRDIEQMIRQAADALQYAHDHQIIHQDVKPTNFLVRFNQNNPDCPDLLLTDFGIARLASMTSHTSQSVRGTPSYMAPEQWAGNPSPASDQYALAIMAYELFTGRAPFGGNPMQMMYAHVNTPPPPASSINPRLPSMLDVVLLHALAKRPEGRYPSVSAFAQALRQSLQGSDPNATVREIGINWNREVSTPKMAESSGMYITLAISEEEARIGSNRMLTLAGGRQVNVTVPPGTQHGQVLTIRNSGAMGSGNGGEVLYLTFSVVPSLKIDNPPSFAGISDQSTVFSQRPNPGFGPGSGSTPSAFSNRGANPGGSMSPQFSQGGFSPNAPTYAATGAAQQGPVSSPSFPENQLNLTADAPVPPPRKRGTNGRMFLLIGLAVLVVLTSSGLLLYFGVLKQGSNLGGGGGTPTTGFTATINTTSTVVGSTATATTAVTPTSGVTPTAQPTVTPTANPNPYGGTLVLNDPLTDNSAGNNWQITNDSIGNSCQFTGGAYHVILAPHYGGPCLAQNTNFTNFAFQVQMTIVRADTSFSGGGLTIRSSAGNYYYFEIFESGRYVMAACKGNDCSHAIAESLTTPIANFHSGLNQTNTIAIVAQGNSFTLYVNGQVVTGPVTDSSATSSQGMIGLYGEANNVTTEVVYSNAKVWTL